ncbi:MAG: hypothetical protein CTY35_05400 [Methylotenera sp.]|nr:MAG: hypothetical protein CTY35_05400 [Methylotenera sp.]
MSEQDPVVRDTDYFLANQNEYDALSEEQITELLTEGVITVGDTNISDSPNADKPQDADDSKGGDEQVVDEQADLGAEPKGILSKDGQHVIPFSRLTEAQEEAAKYKELVTSQQQLIDKLTAAKEADVGTGDTKAQDDVLAELRTEFPELAEKLAPAISKMVEQGVSATMAKLDSLIKPLQANAEESAADKHFNAIRAVHSDFDTLMEGDAVDKWIDKQPTFLRGRFQEVLQKGTANEVTELLNAYKEANSTAVKEPSKQLSADELKAAAKSVVDKAKGEVRAPSSLSDFPVGANPSTDELTALTELSPAALLGSFEGKTPEQINAIVSKLI